MALLTNQDTPDTIHTHWSIPGILAQWAESDPKALALLAPGRKPISYCRLWRHLEETAGTLRALGIAREDRVAVVLPNGPEMASAFLAVAAAATCAPLNPAYRVPEFEFYLTDLKPKALILEAGSDSPAATVAKSLGIPVVRLSACRNEEAGLFALEGTPPAGAIEVEFAQPGDVALVLHTSGTTSRPKIVPLTQANLCHSARNIQASLRLTPAERCLNVMPLFHIHGLVGATLSSLVTGATVVCTPGFYAPRFFEWLDEFGPSWYTAVPTMHQAILGRAEESAWTGERTSLRFIRSCSSALPPQVMSRMERVFRVPVIEAYGMTEAAHQMASNPLPPAARKPGSVGVATGPDVAIMDEHGALMGPEQTGEVVIRGANVTPGYENNPEANASAFTAGWFRTGDQGRIDGEGYLYLTGRIKEIINRGGEKISPREIDEVLMDHAAVAQAVTFAIPDARLGEDVGAAVVLRGDSSITERELCEYAYTRLADFKVPRRIVFLKEIPKGPTGKPQRIGLAAKLGITENPPPVKDAAPYTPPGTPAESMLVELWQKILGRERIGIDDNFFDLGGDSILAAQISTRIRQSTGAELTMLELFRNPTVALMAKWLESRSSRDVAPAPTQRVPRGGDLPLSFAQQRMWFLARYEQDAGAYNWSAVFRIRGALRKDALEWALGEIVRRHEAVRTTFPDRDGSPVAVICEPTPFSLPAIDLSELPEAEREREAGRRLRQQARSPFDLTRDLLLRASLLKLGPEEHVLLLTMHHIGTDGWSRSVLLCELRSFYEVYGTSRGADLPQLPIQYADFASWQRDWLQGSVLEDHLAYWKGRLAGSHAVLQLPTDHPRPAHQSYRGVRHSLTLSSELAAALKALCREETATLFMTLLGVFQTLLSRYTGAEDIVVGSPVAGRTRVETEALIGLFTNTLALRTDLSGDPTFRQLLARVRDAALRAYEHQDLPFEKLVEELQPERSLSHTPLFQVMFQIRNYPRECLRQAGLEIEELVFDSGVAQFDLTLECTETTEGMQCTLIYNTDLFEEATARRMLGHYRTLLEAVAKDPDQRLSTLPLLSEPERRQLLVEWNQTRAGDTPACLHDLIERQAEHSPDSVAVECDRGRLSYRELNRRANQLAQFLRRQGVDPGTLVAICIERSLEMMVAILGILKAGGAYVPLDPAYPLERLAFLLEDSKAPFLLTMKGLAGTVPSHGTRAIRLDADWNAIAQETDRNPISVTDPDSLAYVIYTSGSTGRPKGVAVPHRGVSNVLAAMRREIGFSESDVMMAVSTLSFDIAVFELCLALVAGGRVVVAGRDTSKNGAMLGKAIADHGVTVMHATPATWQLLLEANWAGQQGLKILCGGETLRRSLTDQLRQRGAGVWNLYGPTETTILSSSYRVTEGEGAVPIGRPIANTQFYVLDRRGQPVPIGVPGELHIAGDGVTRGYLNRAELTADKFVVNPFDANGSRMYRTGDMVRYLPDGNIEFLGRWDEQVKLRGFRIELGEIEATLALHPAVRSCAAALDTDSSADSRLVAYVVLRPGQRATAVELRTFLRQKLPDYMAPGHFVFLDALPLTPNGKVDRRALPRPEVAGTAESAGMSPRNSLEFRLAKIWEELLGRSAIGIRDNFFDVGGHSLLAARLLARIKKSFGLELSLPALFEAPTIEELATILRDHQAPVRTAKLNAIQPGGSRPPFFCIGAGALFRPLALRLGLDQPFLGVPLPGPEALPVPFRLEDVAAQVLRTVREVQPEGPYFIGGWSASLAVAYELAQQLQAQGQEVALLVNFDAPNFARLQDVGMLKAAYIRTYRVAQRLAFHGAALFRLRGKEAKDYVRERLSGIAFDYRTTIWRTKYRVLLRVGLRLDGPMRDPSEIISVTATRYRPRPYSGCMVLFRRCERITGKYCDPQYGWGELVAGGLEIDDIPGNHKTMFLEPNVGILAEKLRASLMAAQERTTKVNLECVMSARR